MSNRMNSRSAMDGRGAGVVCAAIVLAFLGLAGLGGCSSSAAPDATAAQKSILMNFDLSKCQPLEAGLFKCPAVDKPLCNPDMARSDVECIKVAKDGSLYVQGPRE